VSEASLAERQLFPLVPRARLVGLPFGEQRSSRRGPGSDVVGTRPYQPGDPLGSMDWKASARLSAARGDDEFVVRTNQADEAPRVVVVCDRRPAMGVFGPPFPWLSKPRALQAAAELIVLSAVASRGDVGALDYAGAAARHGDPYWLPPGGRGIMWLIEQRESPETGFDAPEDNLERAIAFLGRVRAGIPPGSFVFFVSDFIVAPGLPVWLEVGAHRWDVVPVVIQDPVWEQSFPDVGSVVVPVREPPSGRVHPVRLSAKEAGERRAANEARLQRLLDEFAALGFDPVVLGTDEPSEIDQAFLQWAELRGRLRWRR
jgi:uncharacterized protein (DUF58 family)